MTEQPGAASAYGPGIHILLRVAQAQLADASATLLSHRLRAVVLLAAAVLLLPQAHWLPAAAPVLAAALLTLLAAWPSLTASGTSLDALWQQYGSQDPDDLAAQAVAQCGGCCQDHARQVARCSLLCRWAMVCLLVGAVLGVMRL